MGGFISLIIIVAVAFFIVKQFGGGGVGLTPEMKSEMQRRLQGRTPDQQKVIKYFYSTGGCLSQSISDEEYESMINAKLNSIDFRSRALDQIGLDEDEVGEIEPAHFDNYAYQDNDSLIHLGSDNKWRASKYQVTWLFFSADQIYIYQYTFDMTSDSTNEFVEEYFYKDVTNVASASESREIEVPSSQGCSGKVTVSRSIVNYDTFKIVVPGERRACSMKKTQYSEDTIRGMKAMLREKKQG